MNPILIDTNAYVAFKRGDGEALKVLRRAPAVGINAVVLGELRSGFAAGSREAENLNELAEFLALPKVATLVVDHETANYYAQVYVRLRNAGTPIPTNDMWIAAGALQHGYDLYSFDVHFQNVEGLRTGTTLDDFHTK